MTLNIFFINDQLFNGYKLIITNGMATLVRTSLLGAYNFCMQFCSNWKDWYILFSFIASSSSLWSYTFRPVNKLIYAVHKHILLQYQICPEIMIRPVQSTGLLDFTEFLCFLVSWFLCFFVSFFLSSVHQHKLLLALSHLNRWTNAWSLCSSCTGHLQHLLSNV